MPRPKFSSTVSRLVTITSDLASRSLDEIVEVRDICNALIAGRRKPGRKPRAKAEGTGTGTDPRSAKAAEVTGQVRARRGRKPKQTEMPLAPEEAPAE